VAYLNVLFQHYPGKTEVEKGGQFCILVKGKLKNP
jgi:hypothetical protein